MWMLALFSCICYLFWHEDWKYSLPTAVPDNYHPVPFGGLVSIAGKIKQSNRPVFLHFFNPDCPCSRFNIPHFRSLVRTYGGRIDFAVVVLSEQKKYTADDLRDKFNLDIPVYFDKSIADSCGVYSTPQAVLIGTDRKLYYRGNYNKSRYCADKNTNYAKMAIDSMLTDVSTFSANEAAVKSYGCSLPNCAK
jgi:hypothetical protein